MSTASVIACSSVDVVPQPEPPGNNGTQDNGHSPGAGGAAFNVGAGGGIPTNASTGGFVGAVGGANAANTGLSYATGGASGWAGTTAGPHSGGAMVSYGGFPSTGGKPAAPGTSSFGGVAPTTTGGSADAGVECAGHSSTNVDGGCS